MSPPPSTALPAPPPVQPHWALFLDVDGCLLDFADHPDEVEVPRELGDALSRLSHALDGALAFVSGRRIEQLDVLFSPLRLPAAGLHGLQLREHADHVYVLDEAPGALRNLHDAARPIVDANPGARIEDKGAALALHWRAAPAARSALEALAATAVAQLPGYRLQHGDCVVELRPAHGDKGTAVRHLMTLAPFAGRVPVFAGDDLTDEDGFLAVNDLGGLSVRVGHREPSVATHTLADTSSLRAWLAEAADRLGGAR